MPKRTDLKSILVIGAGPIVIGQACEFDYSGVQACKALKDEGYRVILVNSNPATIMTDPGLADATYVEPITPDMVARIIEKEKPDAILPTMGGQTALNTAMALHRDGRRKKFKVELHGADFLREKRIQGSSMGSNHFRQDMPRLVEFYLNGKLHLDDWVSAKIKLEEINEGFANMKAGKVVRSVIQFN